MEDIVEPFLRQMKNHKLELVEAGARVQTYRLFDPALGGMQSCYILFTPAGIIIAGDWTPNDNQGCVSSRGYSVEWFSTPKSLGYLCEKFLRTDWHTQLAIDWLKNRDWNREAYGQERSEKLFDLGEELEEEGRDNIDQGKNLLWEGLNELEIQIDSLPGTGYDPRDAGLLAAIQKKFAELYQPPEEKFFVVDCRERGDLIVFWGPRNSGYTTRIAKAGLYTRAQIEGEPSYYNNGNETIAVPESFIRDKQFAVCELDGKLMADMRSAAKAAFPSANSQAPANPPSPPPVAEHPVELSTMNFTRTEP